MENKNPFFSIIIPAYNCSSVIIQALNSIVSQGYLDYEVIVVNDCSSDDTPIIIDGYVKEHPTVKITTLNTKYNLGPGEVRNIAIGIAQGDYIVFLDADDTLSKDYFAKIVEVIKKNAPELVYIGYCHIFGNLIRTFIPTEYSCKQDLIAYSTGSLWRYVVKRDLLADTPLPSIRNAEDIAIIPLLISKSNKIAYCQYAIYNYIHDNNSLSSRHSPQVIHNFIKSFEYTKSYFNKPYKTGVEFHGIKTILYGALLNGIKAKMAVDELSQVINDFENDFPLWYQNKYLQTYPQSKKFFLMLVHRRLWGSMKLYVTLHNLFLKLI